MEKIHWTPKNKRIKALIHSVMDLTRSDTAAVVAVSNLNSNSTNSIRHFNLFLTILGYGFLFFFFNAN